MQLLFYCMAEQNWKEELVCSSELKKPSKLGMCWVGPRKFVVEWNLFSYRISSTYQGMKPVTDKVQIVLCHPYTNLFQLMINDVLNTYC